MTAVSFAWAFIGFLAGLLAAALMRANDGRND